MTSEDIKHQFIIMVKTQDGEPVWPSGKAGKQNDLDSIPLWLSFLF